VSIYASFCCMGEDEDIPAPIAYIASHLLPKPGDSRAGSLDLGLIPGFVTQDGWCVLGHDHSTGDDCPCEPYTELPPVWPYLRVAVDDVYRAEQATVVLDYSQVEKLRDELTGWLNRAVTS